MCKSLLFVSLIISNLLYSQNESELIKWNVVFNSKDLGETNIVLHYIEKDSSFEMFSRRDADKDLFGKSKASMLRSFTKSFNGGSLINVVKTSVRKEKDTTFLKGIFVSAFGNYYFNGKIAGDSLISFLQTKNKSIAGQLNGSKKKFGKSTDYVLLYQDIKNLTKNKLFDPKILKSRKWEKFNENMENVSTKAKDDIEFIFAFFFYKRSLPFSHYYLFKESHVPLTTNSTAERQSNLKYKKLEDNVGLLTVSSFGGSKKEVDSVFSHVNSDKIQKLIIDLRGNSGGSIEAGLTLMKHLIDTTYYGGVFLTQKYFQKYSELPKTGDYNQFEKFNEANFDLLIEGIHNKTGLYLFVDPNETNFKGELHVLINSATASTCEPLIYALKKSKRALLIGETSAGAMLNGEIFKLEKGYSLVVPTATYYTSDGFKIDKVGVKPNIKVKSNQALKKSLSLLSK